MTKNHGAVMTVKWLKAVSVSIQKELGQDRVSSLRIFEAELPLPRLTNGLPRIIPVSDRALIRRGDVRVIRFWLSLFNLYRILKIPGVLKLQTITGEFTGSSSHLENMIARAKVLKIFDLKEKVDLVPRKFEVSRSASPSNKLAAQGILTDIYDIFVRGGEVSLNITKYLHTVAITNPKASAAFLEKVENGKTLATRLQSLNGVTLVGKSGRTYVQHDLLSTKNSVRMHGFPGPGTPIFGQFALKEEAAGKIRLFALLDSFTQSILRPIHDQLFSILRNIPNDGTFNQEASIRRSMEKAKAAGCAFSFDLTAATDRLPATLTGAILEGIFKIEGLGSAWLSVMINRDFFFNEKVAQKLKISEGPYRYAVGQPMGGLSSWPGLAVTHHWIMQIAAYNVGVVEEGWYVGYEILGDDIVIFDALVADEYLRLMTYIGCEINLSKSINSHSRPVFEFAKRTCWGDHIVSGISLAQLRAGWSVGARVANCLQLTESGFITNIPTLQTTLSRFASLELNQKDLGLSVFAALGALLNKGKVSLELLAHAIFDPRIEDFEYRGEAVGLPLAASLKALLAYLKGETPDYPFSQRESRQELFKEYRSEISSEILDKAMEIATRLYEEEPHVDGARTLYVPWYCESNPHLTFNDIIPDLPGDVTLLIIQIEGYFYNDILNMEFAKENPENLFEELEAALYKHAKGFYFSFEEAMEFLNRAERLEFKLTLKEPSAPGKFVIETSPALGILRRMMNWEGKLEHPRFKYQLQFRQAY